MPFISWTKDLDKLSSFLCGFPRNLWTDSINDPQGRPLRYRPLYTIQHDSRFRMRIRTTRLDGVIQDCEECWTPLSGEEQSSETACQGCASSGQPCQSGVAVPPNPAQSTKRTVLNLWEHPPPPEQLHEHTPREQYDINFRMPFRILETEHVRVEPFVVSLPLGHLGDIVNAG